MSSKNPQRANVSMNLSLIPIDLQPIAEKVDNRQRITDAEALQLYRSNDLNALGIMASAARVQVVARYLANHYEIPVRNISMLGSGYAKPVADDKTREGRKMNRRVEVRLWVPESQSGKTVASNIGQ